MSNPSNLYAEKIFAEHPLAMWPLDEPSDYISLISDQTRESTAWAISPFTQLSASSSELDILTTNPLELGAVPFLDSPVFKFAPIPQAAPGQAAIETLSISPASQPVPISSVSLDLKNVTFGFYLRSLHSYTVGLTVGYVLSSATPNASDIVVKRQVLSQPIPGEWSMYSVTLDLPQVTDKTHIYPFISIAYSKQALFDNSSDYGYLINGISFGQWSENFNVSSLGIENKQPFTDTNINADYYIDAYQYGLGSNDGKYLIADNKLLAQNTSMPMVYGSSSLTKILPNPVAGQPSLLIPGMGMLDNSGRYNAYTFETWIRIDARNLAIRKVLGPVFSDNGLYVDGPFLRLKIGEALGSYFVGEWYRPMLVHIRIALNSASLLVNGEEVLSLEFSTESADYGNNTDYPGGIWGVYAYEDVPIVEIDCPAIYSYSVPAIVAKRRFGYGQAVESPDGVNKSFGASTAFIDYAVADYTNNYQYPDMGSWSQGISENIVTDDNTLATPTHSLPDFVFENTDYDSWFATQYVAAQPYFNFAQDPGFIRFNDLAVADQPTAGAYLIFAISEFSENEKTLLRIVNKINGDSFTVKLVSDEIRYMISIRGVEQEISSIPGVIINSRILAAVSFTELANQFGGDVLTFFSNSSQLLMFVAGDNSYTNMFDGNIYKVGICTERNLAKIQSYFAVPDSNVEVYGGESNTATFIAVLDGGIPSSFSIDEVFDHIANYTLVASNILGVFRIDVDSDSYWQDYLPLSYFSQYVTNPFGENYYDLDFLQFNIDYPATTRLLQSRYDTSNELVKTYISFQPIAGGATKQISAFANVEPLSQNNVVSPDSQRSGNWIDRAYEVVDGTIIYPPRDINFNDIAIVTHIELKIRGGLNNKISIRKIQYASQAFNASSANPIGTKFNIPVYPYQKYSSYFDYKSRNPYKIYKGSTPHLYLTKKTGIEKAGGYDPLINRGFLINVNDKSAAEYRVIATQMFLYYSKPRFDNEAVKIFEIQSAYDYIKVYVEPNSSDRNRARIYAVDANTGIEISAIAFYINGRLVNNPILNINEWTALGIRFAEPIPFDNFVGAIRFTGPILVNNISYYESSSLQEIERRSLRLWDAVEANSNSWNYWLSLLNEFGQSYKWRDVLVIASTIFSGIDPADIYKTYTGTNKIIGNDNASFSIGKPSYEVVNGLAWSSAIVKPL
jgi:hypothetical protein